MLGLSCGMQALVSWPGMEPGPSAGEARSLNHQTTGEIPQFFQWVLTGHFADHPPCSLSWRPLICQCPYSRLPFEEANEKNRCPNVVRTSQSDSYKYTPKKACQALSNGIHNTNWCSKHHSEFLGWENTFPGVWTRNALGGRVGGGGHHSWHLSLTWEAWESP